MPDPFKADNELDDITEAEEQAYEAQLDSIDSHTPEASPSQSESEDTKPASTEKKSLKQRLKAVIKSWWNNKKLRYATFAAVGFLLLLAILIPPSRYFLLNTLGVRSKTSVVIYDQSSKLPLKNVQVSISGKTTKTNQQGKAELTGIKLGKQNLSIEKRAFAEVNKPITIGWGSNPLGNIEIQPVGAQYTFYLTDWLTGKPVGTGEAVSGEFSALADKEGKILLTVEPNNDDDQLEVQVTSGNYRVEKIKFNLDDKTRRSVKLVPGRKHPFFTRRDGKYDLYKVDVDGKNEQLVLAGTGYENETITMISHPSKDIVAVVNTRDNVRNNDGYLLQTLTMVDLSDNANDTIAQSEVVKLIGWSGDKLVYLQRTSGTSAANPERNKLFIYDSKTTETKLVAKANGFNDVKLIGSDIYYAPGNSYQAGEESSYLKQSVNGGNPTKILDKEVWNVFRTDYNNLDISVSGQKWYTYSLGDTSATASQDVPSSFTSIHYQDSLDGKHSIWSEDRDGQGTLLVYDIASGKDKILKQQSGLRTAVRWLDNTSLVYRISDPQETADYIININGGGAKKIRDITSTQPIGD